MPSSKRYNVVTIFFLFSSPAFHVLATRARSCYVSAVSAAPSTGCRISLAARCLIVLQKRASLAIFLCFPSPRSFHFVLARGWVSWRAGLLRSVTGFQAASLASARAAAVDRRRPTTACTGARRPGDRPRCSLVRIEARHGHVRASVGHHETAGAGLFF